jgi:glycosyltransferase involved in cell wall biosynthesis
MKVLHLAPLWFPVAQDSLGGVETFLTHLIRALEDLGCSSTLIASGDSQTAAELVPVIPLNLCAQMEAGSAAEYVYYEQHQLLLALQRASEFDVVHLHIGWGGYVLSGALSRPPVLHTQHNPVYGDQEWFVCEHPDLWYSTVSQFQARKFKWRGATRCHVIHNGIDVSGFTFQAQSGDGLLFIGRMEEEKGPDLALQVAQTLGRPLTLAGPIIDEEFFDRAVKPFLNGQIQYVGVVDHRQKTALFGQAACVLMPSRVDEGCPIVSFEAMACGTPVVALANGALPEIVEAGLTGFVTHMEGTLPTLVSQAVGLDRAAIRARVEARFDISVVAAHYYELYQHIATTPDSTPGRSQ